MINSTRLVYDLTIISKFSIITNMDKTLVTFKLWTETRKLFRLISATTGETIMVIAHRLAEQEWKRLQDDTSTQDSSKPDA